MTGESRKFDLARLRDPFDAGDVEWRVAQCGKGKTGYWARVLAYVTSRAIMARLDEVCGPENWCNEFRAGPQGGVVCGISIFVAGRWVTKWDGADNTQVEAIKGGLSDAMKRSAVQWGVGRYLYDLDEGWAEICDKSAPGARIGQTRNKETFWWLPPPLPRWALPSTLADSSAVSRHPLNAAHPNGASEISPVGARLRDACRRAAKEFPTIFGRSDVAVLEWLSGTKLTPEQCEATWAVTSEERLGAPLRRLKDALAAKGAKCIPTTRG
jgi:hypothetical protein